MAKIKTTFMAARLQEMLIVLISSAFIPFWGVLNFDDGCVRSMPPLLANFKQRHCFGLLSLISEVMSPIRSKHVTICSPLKVHRWSLKRLLLFFVLPHLRHSFFTIFNLVVQNATWSCLVCLPFLQNLGSGFWSDPEKFSNKKVKRKEKISETNNDLLTFRRLEIPTIIFLYLPIYCDIIMQHPLFSLHLEQFINVIFYTYVTKEQWFFSSFLRSGSLLTPLQFLSLSRMSSNIFF